MIFRRLRNLWELSHFKITEFDNQLVITRNEKGGLEYAHRVTDTPPVLAQVISKKDDIINKFVNNG